MRKRLVVVLAFVLAGCTAAAPETGYEGVAVIEDLDFGAADGIRLDVCLPEEASATALPAVLSVHGGGWREGDKAQRPWRDACAWLASEGFVVFQPNYRLAPEHPYPAAIDDVTRAAEWIRADAQVARFGHDPTRLGAFGDSAGGNLVSLLATRGDGIAAVVELSAPLDLTRHGIALGDLGTGFQRVQLDYLGCDSYADCPDARAASPVYAVDADTPPFFIAHSLDEFIPVEQAERFVELLEASAVEVTYVPVAGSEHALGLLDDTLRASIAAWLHLRLGD